MYIDLVIYPIILFLGYQYGKGEEKDTNKKRFIYSASILLLMKISLRSVSVGSDTCHYAQYFIEMHKRPWSEILKLFVDRYYVEGLLAGDDDIGYQLLTKAISSFTDSFGVFTFILQGLLFFMPIGILLYKHCSNVKELVFSYILLNALFLGLPMANARQVYAIGLSIYSIMFLIDKKYVYTGICVLFALTIHKSSLLTLLPICFYYMQPKWFKVATVASFFVAPVSLIRSGGMISAMGTFISSEKYAAYGHDQSYGGAVVYITLSLLMALFCAISLWKEYNTKESKIKLLFCMIPLTVIFCPLIYNNGSMIRITLYFQIYFLVLMPIAVKSYFKNPTSMFNMLNYVLMALSLLSATEYKFFWEEDQNPLLYW